MRQHTAIHDFTGGYSYFYWMMLYACFFATCRRTLSSVGGAYAKFGVLLVDLCAVFFLMPILNQYLLNDFAALMDLR
jgi:hypothetical protein